MNLLDSEASILCTPNSTIVDQVYIRVNGDWYTQNSWSHRNWFKVDKLGYVPDFGKYKNKWYIKPLPSELAAELVMARLEGRIK